MWLSIRLASDRGYECFISWASCPPLLLPTTNNLMTTLLLDIYWTYVSCLTLWQHDGAWMKSALFWLVDTNVVRHLLKPFTCFGKTPICIHNFNAFFFQFVWVDLCFIYFFFTFIFIFIFIFIYLNSLRDSLSFPGTPWSYLQREERPVAIKDNATVGFCEFPYYDILITHTQVFVYDYTKYVIVINTLGENPHKQHNVQIGILWNWVPLQFLSATPIA